MSVHVTGTPSLASTACTDLCHWCASAPAYAGKASAPAAPAPGRGDPRLRQPPRPIRSRSARSRASSSSFLTQQ